MSGGRWNGVGNIYEGKYVGVIMLALHCFVFWFVLRGIAFELLLWCWDLWRDKWAKGE